MKKFTLKRKYRQNEATLGTILDENQKEVCKTLENPWIDNKEKISCIPEGTYNVKRDDGGKFKYWKIVNVANRSDIEIHNGNKQKDTKGCLIIGKKWAFIDDELAVSDSVIHLEYLKNKKILPDEFLLEIKAY